MEKCKNCGHNIVPCDNTNNGFGCEYLGWQHVETQSHGCGTYAKYADPKNAEPYLLSWEKPKKIRSSKEHADMYASDTDVPGTYVPNMSEEDKEKWKAKQVKGEDPRIEIRKTVYDHGPRWSSSVQMLIVVRKDHTSLSLNGTAKFSHQTLVDLTKAIKEAQEKLKETK